MGRDGKFDPHIWLDPIYRLYIRLSQNRYDKMAVQLETQHQ